MEWMIMWIAAVLCFHFSSNFMRAGFKDTSLAWFGSGCFCAALMMLIMMLG
jgi:hypothetical protein